MEGKILSWSPSLFLPKFSLKCFFLYSDDDIKFSVDSICGESLLYLILMFLSLYEELFLREVLIFLNSVLFGSEWYFILMPIVSVYSSHSFVIVLSIYYDNDTRHCSLSLSDVSSSAIAVV